MKWWPRASAKPTTRAIKIVGSALQRDHTSVDDLNPFRSVWGWGAFCVPAVIVVMGDLGFSR